MFFPTAGADGGYTAAGTWISYNGPAPVKAIAEYATAQGLHGVFAFDANQDTLEGGAWTYTLIHLVADTPGPAPPPPPGPSPSPGPAPPPGPPPAHGVCAGKAAGMYCVPGANSSFVYCPQGAVEHCAAKTCCKSTGPGKMVCDWCR